MEGKLSNRFETSLGASTSDMVTVGCLTAFVIDRARELGCASHANALEKCLTSFLKAMPKEQRRQTIMLSHDIALKNMLPEPVKLRLVHSRD